MKRKEKGTRKELAVGRRQRNLAGGEEQFHFVLFLEKFDPFRSRRKYLRCLTYLVKSRFSRLNLLNSVKREI